MSNQDRYMPPKHSRVVASERISGGPGLVPRRSAGIGKDIAARIREAAIDIVCDIYNNSTDEVNNHNQLHTYMFQSINYDLKNDLVQALLLDWGLTKSNCIKISDVVQKICESEFCTAIVRMMATERCVARSSDENTLPEECLRVCPGESWTKNEIDTMVNDKEWLRDVAHKFCTYSLSKKKLSVPPSSGVQTKKKVNVGARLIRYVHYLSFNKTFLCSL